MTHVPHGALLGLLAILVAAAVGALALTRPAGRAASRPVAQAPVDAGSPLAAWACWRLAVVNPAGYDRRFGSATACVAAVAPYVETATASCATSFARKTQSFYGCILAYTRPAHAPGRAAG